MHIVRDESDAEDITQESFVRTLRHLRDGDIDEPHAFLYVLARNLALDLVRSHRRRFTVALPDEQGASLPAPGAETAALARLQMGDLARALAGLPARSREIFIHRAVLGHSFKELSRATGMPVSTLEKQVAQGVRHCRLALGHSVGAA